jgi:predicted Zn-dependent peptidase
LTGVLGGGASSRLFQKVREERGLCYGIDAFGWSFSDSGLVGVHAAANSDAVAEIMTIVASEIRDLADHGPTAPELSRVKAQMRAGILMSFESSAARAEQLARQTMAYGAPQASGTLIANIDSVAAGNLRDLTRAIFGAKNFVWSEVGPGADGRFASAFQHLTG